MSRPLVAVLTALLLLAAACSGGDDDTAGSDATADTAAPGDTADRSGGGAAGESGSGWTFLVYQIADTDLEPFALLDLMEMAQVGSQDGLNIVSLVDRAEGYAEGEVLNLPEFTSSKLVEVAPGELVEKDDLGELDMGDPATLADFIEYGVTNYPAEHYALVLWDHGAGWPGVGPDESSGDVLDLADLDQALADGLQRAGLASFDLLGFDACLMATYEVAATAQPYASYLLASQELEPGHGWDYASLQVLADDPSADAVTLGTALADGFLAQGVAEGQDAEITLSLVDLSQVPALDEAVGGLSVDAAGDIATVAPALGAVRTRTLGFGANPDPTLDSYLTDLGGLAKGLEESGGGSTGAAEVLAALEDAVVYSVAGPATQAATGLSVYFPPTAEAANGDYQAVAAAAGWVQLLGAYFQAGDEIPAEALPQFLNPDGLADYFFDADGLNLAGSFDPAAEPNIAEAYIQYGYLDANDGSLVYYGDEPADWSTDGSGLAAGIYDLTYFTITDGEDTSQAYFSLSEEPESGLATVDVPLFYLAPEDIGTENYQDVSLSIVVDPETGDVLQETYYVVDPETGSYGELYADPQGLIIPVIFNVYPDGSSEWIPTNDVGLFADLPNLQYGFEPVPSGTQVAVDLTIVDFGGNSSTVSAQDVAP
ncbi:MAG: hypothetical protein IPM45_00585 [Acidimicrobiales bacterium]|nr:hypothetical protein [Acidimicrobiales bacterium]